VTVLYCADTRFPIERANGVQTMATCHALAALGHDVTLLSRPDSSLAPRDPFAFYGRAPLERLRFETVPASAGRRAARVRFLLHAAARAAQTRGILYTRDLGLAAFLLQLPAPRRPRVVYESHGLAPTVSEELPRLLGQPELRPTPHKLRRLDRREQRVWRRAAAYVTITRALADELAARYGPRHPVFVVPDGATLPDETSIERARPRLASGAPAVAGYAGHLYPWKGVDVFVRALALTPQIRGLIVGGHPREADRERLESLIDTLGLGDRVEITGLVPPGDVRRHLCRATMLVLPNTASAISERYTSPLKLFEYLTLGRPIVASDLPALREILAPDETALLVSPGDPRALAAAMTRLAADPALAARLGDAALSLAPSYSWDARARRLQPVLEAARSA
jgi:glycosyltransferase involved in cell wall biosynthesis